MCVLVFIFDKIVQVRRQPSGGIHVVN
jgi:hypothetical protein